MATDKFRALALECEDLPDDSLLRILSGEFNLDALTVGMVTRQIMGVIATAPSRLSPAVYHEHNAALVAFRKGTLDQKADMLEASVPTACAATRQPTPGGLGNIVFGYGYPTPGDLWGIDYSSPGNLADEIGYVTDGSYDPPSSWVSITPGGPLPPVPAFSQSAAGAVFVNVWMRNCYNRALGNNGDFAGVSANVLSSTSPLAPVVYGQAIGEVNPDPTSVDLCQLCIAHPGTATELAIRRDDPNSGQVVYTGTPSGPAMFDITCADVSQGSPIPLYFIFSAGGGLDEIILPSYVFPQNSSGSCNP